MTILNLSLTPATADLMAHGVVDLFPADQSTLHQLLTFENTPSEADLDERAVAIAGLAAMNQSPDDREDGRGFAHQVLINAVPALLLAPLCHALYSMQITPVFLLTPSNTLERPLILPVPPQD